MFEYADVIDAIADVNFTQFLEDQPEVGLNVLSIITQICIARHDENNHMDVPIIMRLLNHGSMVSIGEIRAHHVDKLVTTKGVIGQASVIKPFVVSMDYECTRCHRSRHLRIVNGRIPTFSQCLANNPRCKGKKGIPLIDSVRCIDHQTISIMDENAFSNGSGNTSMKVELRNKLVDKFVCGQTVIVSGILKLDPEKVKRSTALSTQSCYLIANSVEGSPNAAITNNEYEFTSKDYSFIRELYDHPDMTNIIVNSFCPAIYGHNCIKKSLLMALISTDIQTRTNGKSKQSQK